MPIKIELESGSNQEDQATNAAGLDKAWTENAISNTNPVIMGPLYIPSVVGPETTEYEWLWTHYTVYRTLDIENAYARLDELDTSEDKFFNDPERFVWTKDLRVMGAFWATKGGGIITALIGEFELADVGSTIEWDNGDRDEITAYVNSTTVRYRLTGDRYYEDAYTRACCIGNGRVMRASQAGDIVTRTVGSVFTAADERKTLQWADGYRSYVVGYINANQVRVHESFDRDVQGLTLDPRYRYYNDAITDSQLRSRLTTLLLKTRFWRALSNCNGGVLPPGFMVTYQRNDNVIRYSQMPENYEYMAGYHNPTIQLTRTIKDDIQFMKLFPDKIVAWTTRQTYYSPTNVPGEFITPEVGEVVATIPGFEVLDGDKGLFDRGSIQDIGNGNIQLLTSEPDRVALRQFNGTSYSDDKAFIPSLGQGRMSRDLQGLQHATASLYTPEGHYIWGRDIEYGTGVAGAVRSATVAAAAAERSYRGTTMTWGAGGTYATLVAALNALPNPLDADYTLLQVGDSTETGQHLTNAWDYGQYTVTITSDTPHNGDRNVGWVCTVTPAAATAPLILVSNGFAGFIKRFIVRDIHFVKTATGGVPAGTASIFDITISVRDIYFTAYNNIFDGTGVSHRALSISNAGVGYVRIYNNMMYAHTFGTIQFNVGSMDQGIEIENNTIDNSNATGASQVGISVNAGSTLDVQRNNVVIGSDSNDYLNAGTITTSQRNASEDATGDVGYRNIVPADEFENLVEGGTDYMVPVRGTVIRGALSNTYEGGSRVIGEEGATPTYALADITGESRPGGDNFTSIGAFEKMYTVNNEESVNVNLDIQAVPREGLAPTGVQFSNFLNATVEEIT
jgi:hypothetical protein